MAEELKMMPTGNLQMREAMRSIILPELAELKKQLDRIEKKIDDKATSKVK